MFMYEKTIQRFLSHLFHMKLKALYHFRFTTPLCFLINSHITSYTTLQNWKGLEMLLY